MAEIKNYTLNFGYSRAQCALNFALAKLAFTEIGLIGAGITFLCLREANFLISCLMSIHVRQALL